MRRHHLQRRAERVLAEEQRAERERLIAEGQFVQHPPLKTLDAAMTFVFGYWTLRPEYATLLVIGVERYFHSITNSPYWSGPPRPSPSSP